VPWNPARHRSCQLTPRKKFAAEADTMNKTTDRLTIVTDQMNALAAELRHLGNDPARREEIVVQIIRLGKLLFGDQSWN
jgi:hypothetical protein